MKLTHLQIQGTAPTQSFQLLWVVNIYQAQHLFRHHSSHSILACKMVCMFVVCVLTMCSERGQAHGDLCTHIMYVEPTKLIYNVMPAVIKLHTDWQCPLSYFVHTKPFLLPPLSILPHCPSLFFTTSQHTCMYSYLLATPYIYSLLVKYMQKKR